jgi:REP element-mobilizing transposase RayT
MKGVPRQTRYAPPDSILHVYDRGVDRQDIFRDDGDRRTFLAFARHYFEKHGISLLAYCLMGNHFHFLLSPSEVPLSLAMHDLLLRYSVYFNARHGRVGHLFQNRFASKPCRNLAYLFHLISYIHLNPVRAGLVSTPQAWPWSSHGAYSGGEDKYLDLSRLEAVSGVSRDELSSYYQDKLDFWKTVGERSLEELMDLAASFVGMEPEELAEGERGGDFTVGRRLFVRWGLAAGYRKSQLAEALQCSKAAVSKMATRS